MRLGTTGRTLKTLETTLTIIEALKDLDGARISEVAEYVDVSKSTVHNHLSTLQNHGFVATEGDVYYIGLEFTNLGEYAKTRKEEYARGKELAEEIGQRLNIDSDFTVEENGLGVYLSTSYKADGQYPEVGDRFYLHSTAAGKAMLSQYPRKYVDQILDRWGLVAQTDDTITDREILYNELDVAQENGYAFNRGETTKGIRAVSVPVKASDGTVLGATTVHGPKYRMDDKFEREIPARMLEVVSRYADES